MNHPFYYMIVYALMAGTSSFYAFMSYRPRMADHGWRRVTPGAAHHAFLILSGCAVPLLLLAYLSGSDELLPVDRGPVLIGLLLIGAAFICALWSVLTIRRRGIQWRDGFLSFRNKSGKRVVYGFEQIVELSAASGASRLFQFDDGFQLYFDANARGANLLFDLVVEDRYRRFSEQNEQQFVEVAINR